MKHPTLHEPTRTPQPGIDRSINQDDDSAHPIDAVATPSRRDAFSGTNAWDKRGLVDNSPVDQRPVQVDFDFGPTQERRRH